MKQLAYALALTGMCAFGTVMSSTPAAALETYEAQMTASDAASARLGSTCWTPSGQKN